MWQVKSMALRTHRFAVRSLLLVGATTLLASVVLVPTVSAQVVISLTPPVCSYGYYEYAPYACAPSGFYGPGYFFNGIFLGVGPWASWGYNHGWGGHRFSGAGGGRYVAGRRDGGGRGGASVVRANRSSGSRGGASHAATARGGSSHGGSHASAARGGGGGSHAAAAHGGGSHGGGGGGSHGGGERR